MSEVTAAPGTTRWPQFYSLADIALPTQDEGWAAGATFAWDEAQATIPPTSAPIRSALLLHYIQGEWQPVDDRLPLAMITSLSMLSPTEGWATADNYRSGETALLRCSGGHWRVVDPPFVPADGAYFSLIRMVSPDQGWLVVSPRHNLKNEGQTHIYQYDHGRWRAIADPPVLTGLGSCAGRPRRAVDRRQLLNVAPVSS